MYQTIEAEFENGRLISPELQKLPAVAHVLITWINSSGAEQKNRRGLSAPLRHVRCEER